MAHPTEEVRPHMLQATQVQSHVEKLQQISTSLKKFPDDGRATDSIQALDYVIARLSDQPYDAASANVAVTDDLSLADAALAQASPSSPGVDAEGNPLPPFSPPEFP